MLNLILYWDKVNFIDVYNYKYYMLSYGVLVYHEYLIPCRPVWRIYRNSFNIQKKKEKKKEVSIQFQNVKNWHANISSTYCIWK